MTPEEKEKSPITALAPRPASALRTVRGKDTSKHQCVGGQILNPVQRALLKMTSLFPRSLSLFLATAKHHLGVGVASQLGLGPKPWSSTQFTEEKADPSESSSHHATSPAAISVCPTEVWGSPCQSQCWPLVSQLLTQSTDSAHLSIGSLDRWCQLGPPAPGTELPVAPHLPLTLPSHGCRCRFQLLLDIRCVCVCGFLV